MSKETEYQYMQTDDTVDVGKTSLPVNSEKVSDWKDKWLKKTNKFVKEADKER